MSKIRIQSPARFKFNKKDTTAWNSENPVLLSGEIGIEKLSSGTLKIKIGDGVTAWNELGYFCGDIYTALSGKVDKVAGKGLSTNDYDNAQKAMVASAVQPEQLATVATSGAYADLIGCPAIPAKTSDLTNDSGYINDLDCHSTAIAVANAMMPKKTSELNNDSGFLTQNNVDQTYSATSANAQSGIAVAQAINQTIGGINAILTTLVSGNVSS